MSAAHPPRRRWFRYSLRTFLLLLTALCIWMGFIAEKAARQKRAVEAILAAGGIAHFDGDKMLNREIQQQYPDAASAGPQWARKIVGDDFFRTLIGAGVTTDQGDEFVANLATLAPDLKGLQINGPNLSDQSFASIASLRRLESLHLICAKTTSEGLLRLKPLTSLKTVVIVHNPASWDMMQRLDRPTPFASFEETPLPDVVVFLCELSHLPIKFAPAIGENEKNLLITRMHKNVSLKSALREILNEHHLGYFVEGNSVHIATTKACEVDRPGYRTLRSMFPTAEIETDW